MRIALLFATVVTCMVGFGCQPAQYRQAQDRVAHGSIGDAWSPDPVDGSTPPPHEDAAVIPGEDAWVPPGHDAGTHAPDAWVASPDAWTAPTCSTTFAADVEPIYVQHCADCHTTGSEVHFGSSYSVANRTSSSCGGTMAACTITLGRPGGSMARRDSLGGFTTSEIATIQAWIDCGRPM